MLFRKMLPSASSGFPGSQGLGAAPGLQVKNTLTEFCQASTLLAKTLGSMKC